LSRNQITLLPPNDKVVVLAELATDFPTSIAFATNSG
jgi:hypothetical protein